MDGNNHGESWGVAFGSYVCRGIWVSDELGEHTHRLKEDVKDPRDKTQYEKGEQHIGPVQRFGM